ncbi:MAG TPA: urea carboxylase-associated family protein [Ilumatobacteraceae bacterium]
MPSIIVPGSEARAVRLNAGDTVRVVNTHGSQVVDFWALRSDRPEIAMSMQHSRVRWRNLRPKAGDEMLDEERSVIMTMLEDTSPGVHDTVIAACDPFRYQQLGAPPGHRSCCVNFAEALAEVAVTRNSAVPAPLNLFMNIPWDLDGNITFEPTVSQPGDSVLFRAEVDAIAIASACPMDIVPINGPGGGTPVDIELITSA